MRGTMGIHTRIYRLTMLAVQAHGQPALQRVPLVLVSLRRVIRVRDNQLTLVHGLLNCFVLQDRQ